MNTAVATKPAAPITPEQLVPLHLGLGAMGLALDRMERHPHHTADCVASMRESITELRAYVRILQGRAA